MNANQSAKKIEGMTVEERMTYAKDKTTRMVNALVDLVALHENNRLVVYSPLLSGQLPRSFAANAFNVFQNCIHFYEIVRVCAFWDGLDLDKSNIPTVAALTNDPGVLAQVFDATAAFWPDGGTRIYDPDPELQADIEAAVLASEKRFGQEQAGKAVSGLEAAFRAARVVEQSEKLKSVRNLHDKHLAHLLDVTRAEKQGEVAPMKYGDERDLLEVTIQVVEAFYLGINGTSFDWEESRAIARRNAEALWKGCKIEPLR